MMISFLKKIYSVTKLIYEKKLVLSLYVLFNAEKKRYEYGLSENSVVIDGGGYKGDFSKEIFKLYKPNIFMFEPYEYYYIKLKKQFEHNNKVSVSNFALTNQYKEIFLIKFGDKSYISNRKNKNSISIKSTSIVSYLNKKKINKVDLIKLNVEGAEYSILSEILESGCHIKFLNLQIQFHKPANNKNEYLKIRKKLKEKYKLIWRYPWIWESWQLKE